MLLEVVLFFMLKANNSNLSPQHDEERGYTHLALYGRGQEQKFFVLI